MSHLKRSGKVYYHIMKGSRYIFADEVNKKKLLDIVLDVQRQENWHIYAFCLTDDSAYFVTETTDCALFGGMESISEKYLTFCRRCPLYAGSAEWELRECFTKELQTPDEIASYCRKIHRLPLENGYVMHLGDYWWSSYITYTGIYDWDMVDCRTLLVYFSADQDTARRKLKRYHRSFQK